MLRALFLLAAMLLAGGCHPNTGSDALLVGMDLSYPPFETIDESGRPTGVSVELAAALGEFLGRDVEIENLPFTGLIPALQSGKIDIVLSSMTDTPERRGSIAFSDPYLEIGLALLAGVDSPITSPDDADIAGRTLVVRQGTTGEAWARANLKNANILAVDKESTAVMEVLQGKADAFIYDQMSVWTNARKHPSKTRAVLEPLQREAWAVGLRKGDHELRGEVNKFIKAYRENGGFDKLGDQYLPDQKAAFAEQGLPFYF